MALVAPHLLPINILTSCISTSIDASLPRTVPSLTSFHVQHCGGDRRRTASLLARTPRYGRRGSLIDSYRASAEGLIVELSVKAILPWSTAAAISLDRLDCRWESMTCCGVYAHLRAGLSRTESLANRVAVFSNGSVQCQLLGPHTVASKLRTRTFRPLDRSTIRAFSQSLIRLSGAQATRVFVNQRRELASQPNPAAGIQVSKTEHSHGHDVVTITISNPNKLNIVNSALLEELRSVCHGLGTNSNLRVVILTGGPTAAGKAPSFIGGMDIKEMHRLSSAEDARATIVRVHAACNAMRDLPVPVLARVNGYCLGAGLEIMAACDLRIATKDSVFGMPEVKIGIPSVVEAALLPGLIGTGRTRRLLYLAENVDGTTAERWGLVEKLVDDVVELDQAVQDWTGRLVDMGPEAIRSQKRLMRQWEDCTVDEGIERGVEAFAEAFADGGVEPKELMDKFIRRTR
jgi:enoyl-CoA hydratase/carnithine racemase